VKNVVATDALDLKRAFFPAPEMPEQWADWRKGLAVWAEQARATLPAPQIDRAAQAWASRAYSLGFLMLWDEELISHPAGPWQVDRLLDRAEREFGGYDAVVLWSNYPNSGVDGRHQLAYYDELPGGRPALKAAIERFHARGVRVLLDHKPWVKAPVPGFDSIEDAFVEIVRDCNLDGLFLDCSDGPEESFRQRMAERAGPDKIFISEAPTPPAKIGSEIGCWQQMTDDSAAPGVYRNRLLDRRQIVYESRRYFYDPIRELQRGWMNGGGQVVWENVFGYWAAYSPRCKSWMRLLFPAQRRFAEHFIEGDWEPHVGGGAVNGLFVSRWRHNGQELYTAVNRRGHTLQNILFKLPARPGCRWFDVISGQEYQIAGETDGLVELRGNFFRDGLAGILPVQEPCKDLADFLQAQRERFAHADWSAEPWDGEHRKTELKHVVKRAEPGPEHGAERKVWVRSRYRMRECGYIAGAMDELHVYDAFEKECTYSRCVPVAEGNLDPFPVTNADYKRFLEASGYTPADPRNFLLHWVGGEIPAGLESHPVVYVCLEDARAYAAWAGKRLPTEEEWQLAAQGADGRIWPWGGDALDPARCNHASAGTTPVDAYPQGRTPEGLWDLCGNVWEMTESERSDGHTRYQILKGGSWFHVTNSHWLFDTGARPLDWGAKHILLCPAWDRCATIGFRCYQPKI
jgi:hypothetical protein